MTPGRVLISAYACETGRGGEGEIAWRLVHELAKRYEVVVLTRANLKGVHEATFSIQPKPIHLTFEYFDLPSGFRFFKRGKRNFLIYYYLWQVGVALKVRKIQRERKFDVLHHLTGGMDWMPSGLSLCSGPFVWGPVGSENTHPVILSHQALKSRMKEKARVALRWIFRTLEPLTRITAARADVVLSHTPETLPRRIASKVRFATQTGICDDPSLAKPKSDLSRGRRLRLVYAGELKDWKGARMALDAYFDALAIGVDADLKVLGDGPLRAELEALSRVHPKGHLVRFFGQVPMEELVEALYDSDVMLYPTFHHGLATVVLQAMLTRLPVICIEGDATGRVIGQRAGITVPLDMEERPSAGIARAIANLAEDDHHRIRLARAARDIALKSYAYEALATQISNAYLEVAPSLCSAK